MKIRLLDINVLIALAWPSHVHHGQAHAWFAKNAAQGWATCPLTQHGFVRISSNPQIIEDAVTPREAIALLDEIVAHEYHVFWPDDVSLCETEYVPTALLMGHRQVTDAYLLGLAIRNGGQLATLDKRILSLIPSRDHDLDTVELISPE